MVEPSWQSALHRGSHYEPLGTGLNKRQQGHRPGPHRSRPPYGPQSRARHVPMVQAHL